MNKIQVALAQTCSGPDVDDNLLHIKQLLDEKLTASPDILLLPECFASIDGDLSEVGKSAESIRQWMSQQASHYQCWLVGGTIPYRHQSGEKKRAACFVYDPQGNEVARYDKIHLFDVDINDSKGCYRESDDYMAGKHSVTVSLGWDSSACLGLSVCYDLRFPELYRKLVADGANILCIPSAFTYVTGKAHWQSLLRARAIENQCFVLAVNQGGRHPGGRETWGHSMVISPWGEILGELGTGPSLLSVNIDLATVFEIRDKIPCLDHKRL